MKKKKKLSMRGIWKTMIDQIDELIRDVPAGRDGRLMQLQEKRELLEQAFNRVGV